MRKFPLALALLALAFPAHSWAASAHDFFANCAPPTGSSNRTLTVDPQARTTNTYPNISAAIAAAKPGDTIQLMTGDYGDYSVTGLNQDGFITIAAAPNQTPRFTHLNVGGYRPASHWRISGVTVTSLSSGNYPNGSFIHKGLVTIGNSDNIVFEHNNIYSRPGQMTWRTEAEDGAANESLSDGVKVTHGFCISITENHFSNIFNAITMGGDQIGNNGKYLIASDNIIEDFAGDGVDHFGSHVRIERNRIFNGHDICDNKCVHMDGIQGWNYNNKPGLLNTDVVIDGNEIVVQTRPDLAMPADTLQGITIFNGNWDGLQIFNNVVVATAWHGITVYRARNVAIVNNTVAPANPARKTWITYSSIEDPPPGTTNSVVIRNNVAVDISVGKRDAALGTGLLDHNLKLAANDFEDAFVKFDLEHFAFDLHPSRRSDAKGEGTAEGAPPKDIEGNPRKSKVDIGAYSAASS